MAAFDRKDLERRMDGAINALNSELSGLRTGRASVDLLKPVLVDAYGSLMSINQVATVSAPEPRLLIVQVWDKAVVGAVDKGIRNSGLGLNPITEGQLVRVPIPELTEERRKEFAKIAHKYGENSRIAVRNVRRSGMDNLKRMEQDGDISKDQHRDHTIEVQKLTDSFIERIGLLVDAKEAEILQI